MKTVTLLAIIGTSLFALISLVFALQNLGILPHIAIERFYKITPVLECLGNIGLLAFFVQLYQKQIKKANNG
jgi:hypothetical protein